MDSFYFLPASVHFLRKPDTDIFRLALGADRPGNLSGIDSLYRKYIHVSSEVAERLGIRSIHHTDYKNTRTKLVSFGLVSRRLYESIANLEFTRFEY